MSEPDQPLCYTCTHGLCAKQTLEFPDNKEAWEEGESRSFKAWGTMCFWAPAGFNMENPYEMMPVNECSRFEQDINA